MLVSGRVSTLNCTESKISRVPWAKAEGLEYPSPAVNGRRQDDKDRNLEAQSVWESCGLRKNIFGGFFWLERIISNVFLGVIKVIIAW